MREWFSRVRTHLTQFAVVAESLPPTSSEARFRRAPRTQLTSSSHLASTGASLYVSLALVETKESLPLTVGNGAESLLDGELLSSTEMSLALTHTAISSRLQPLSLPQ